MQVIEVGPVDTEQCSLAVIACIHGDEVCGYYAIANLLWERSDFQRHIKFIVANERAFARNKRYIDEDLNRVFPGDPNATSHERWLAAALMTHISGCEVLTLHSTELYPEPFALVQKVNSTTQSLIYATGAEKAVDISYVSGGIEDFVDGVAVECGIKGSDDAMTTAAAILRRFLIARGALDGQYEVTQPKLYRIFDHVDGSEYRFVGQNFERVERDQVFAHRIDGRLDNGVSDKDVLRASRSFYPVLMSTDGYEDILGFQAEFLGPLGRAIDDLESATAPENTNDEP